MGQRLRFASVEISHSPSGCVIMLLVRRRTPVRAGAETRDHRLVRQPPRWNRNKHENVSSSCFHQCCWSSARFNCRTLTPGSPNTPRSRPSVFCWTSSRTLSSLNPRVLATRGTWSSALRKLISGSSPLPDAVTASAGTGSVSLKPFSARYAAIRSLIALSSF